MLQLNFLTLMTVYATVYATSVWSCATLQLIQSMEINDRISFFSLVPEMKQCTSRPGAVCYLLCLFLNGFLFTGHWSVLMLTPVKHRTISSPSHPLKSDSRWPTCIQVTIRNRRKKNWIFFFETVSWRGNVWQFRNPLTFQHFLLSTACKIETWSFSAKCVSRVQKESCGNLKFG